MFDTMILLQRVLDFRWDTLHYATLRAATNIGSVCLPFV
jgi:hypothetical protein